MVGVRRGQPDLNFKTNIAALLPHIGDGTSGFRPKLLIFPVSTKDFGIPVTAARGQLFGKVVARLRFEPTPMWTPGLGV
jgi:hypothetical protein